MSAVEIRTNVLNWIDKQKLDGTTGILLYLVYGIGTGMLSFIPVVCERIGRPVIVCRNISEMLYQKYKDTHTFLTESLTVATSTTSSIVIYNDIVRTVSYNTRQFKNRKVAFLDSRAYPIK